MGVYVLATGALASVPFLIAFFIALCRDDDRKPLDLSVGLSDFVGPAKTRSRRTNLLSFPRQHSNVNEVLPTSGLNVKAR